MHIVNRQTKVGGNLVADVDTHFVTELVFVTNLLDAPKAICQHIARKTDNMVRVNYPGRPATTILAGGGGVIFSSQRGFSVLS